MLDRIRVSLAAKLSAAFFFQSSKPLPLQAAGAAVDGRPALEPVNVWSTQSSNVCCPGALPIVYEQFRSLMESDERWNKPRHDIGTKIPQHSRAHPCGFLSPFWIWMRHPCGFLRSARVVFYPLAFHPCISVCGWARAQ
jgi:hypothetical protein